MKEHVHQVKKIIIVTKIHLFSCDITYYTFWLLIKHLRKICYIGWNQMFAMIPHKFIDYSIRLNKQMMKLYAFQMLPN